MASENRIALEIGMKNKLLRIETNEKRGKIVI